MDDIEYSFRIVFIKQIRDAFEHITKDPYNVSVMDGRWYNEYSKVYGSIMNYYIPEIIAEINKTECGDKPIFALSTHEEYEAPTEFELIFDKERKKYTNPLGGEDINKYSGEFDVAVKGTPPPELTPQVFANIMKDKLNKIFAERRPIIIYAVENGYPQGQSFDTWAETSTVVGGGKHRKKCKKGSNRNPITKKCRKTCKSGFRRNRKTHHCRKIIINKHT